MVNQALPKHSINIGYFLIILTILIFLMSATKVYAAPADSTLAQWTPWIGSARGLCMARPLYCGCGGYYEAPEAAEELENPSDTLFEGDEQFQGVADEYSYNFDGVAELLGNVIIRIDDLQVNAEQMVLDDAAETANFSGNVQLNLPGFRLSGPRAEVSTAEERATIHDAGLIFFDSGLKGSARSVELSGQSGLRILDGKLTSCTPGNESWMLVGNEIDLNVKEGWGTVRHMRIEVKDIPIIYVPYFTFALDNRRKSGFLVPKLNITEPDLSIPYYWNLAPNYDLTLTPRYIGDRGNMLESEFRYLTEDLNGTFELAALPNDERREAANLEPTRTHLDWTHYGDLGAGWDYDINVDYVSDPDYFVDFGNTLTTQSQTFLNRDVNLRYFSPTWSFLTRFQAYQVLDETLAPSEYPYRRSPEVQLSHFNRLTQGLPVYWDNRFSYTYFEQSRAPVPFAHRANWRSVLNAPIPFFWGMVEPKLEIDHRRYMLEDSPTGEDSYEFTIPSVSLDTRLSLRKNNIRGRYWQTLEPRMFVTYTPFEDQSAIPLFDTSELTLDYDQLFLSNTFIGGDRIADKQQVSLGLTTRFFEEETGRMVLRGDIGQGFLENQHTPIITRLIFSPQERLYWTNQINWQDDRDGLYSASSRVSYVRPRDEYRSTDAVSLEYRYREDEIELEGIDQYEISFAHTLNHKLKLLGKVRYDNRESRTFEHLAGFTYSGCCWEASVVYHRLIQTDEISSTNLSAEHGILFEFSLKSLGGIGGGLQPFLQQQIPGFIPRGGET